MKVSQDSFQEKLHTLQPSKLYQTRAEKKIKEFENILKKDSHEEIGKNTEKTQLNQTNIDGKWS
jgi:hypothetical protein